METKAQLLLDAVEQLEKAAMRGIELNQNRDPSIPVEKTISAEQCEWTIRDCAIFRSFIARTFG